MAHASRRDDSINNLRHRYIHSWSDLWGNAMSKTWDEVMAMKDNDTRHKGTANNLTNDELQCVYGTIDYFGGNVRQAQFDMQIARYRVFDFLAMCVMGDRVMSKDATKVLVYSFLKVEGDINKWIEDLRTTDYDVRDDWKEIEL